MLNFYIKYLTTERKEDSALNIDMSGLIDPKIAAALWVIGFGLKHMEWKPIKDFSNRLIPAILIILGIMMSCIMYKAVSFDTIVLGVVTSIFAVGVHASGKNVITELLASTTVTPTANSIDMTSGNLVGGGQVITDTNGIDLADEGNVAIDTNDYNMGGIDDASVG